MRISAFSLIAIITTTAHGTSDNVFIISHDRWLLDRIGTHTLAAERDSQWSFFAGNYQEYEGDKRKRMGEEGAKPKRIRSKPIAR